MSRIKFGMMKHILHASTDNYANTIMLNVYLQNSKTYKNANRTTRRETITLLIHTMRGALSGFDQRRHKWIEIIKKENSIHTSKSTIPNLSNKS